MKHIKFLIMKKLLFFSMVLLLSIGLKAQDYVLTSNHVSNFANQKKKGLTEKKEVGNTYASRALANYNFEEEAGTFSSINASGTSITPDSWDDGEYTLDLSGIYTFSYNLTDYSIFRIGCNGAIVLGSTDANILASNDLAGAVTPMIAPLWDDMKFYDGGSGDGIFYQIDTLTDDTVLTIEWYNVARYGSEGEQVSFQLKLHTNGNIEFIYGDMSPAANWSASASIGLNDTQDGSTAVASVTPGSPATVSYTEANNTIAQGDIAAIPNGHIYRFVPVFVDDDLSAIAISPTMIVPDSDAAMEVEIINIGTNDASNYTVELVINDGTTDVYTSSKTITDVLASYADTIIPMDVWNAVPEGSYTATLTITYAADANSANNTFSTEIHVFRSILINNETDTICNALFYDTGGADGNYSANEDYTITFIPATAGKWLQVEFWAFNVEGEPYDYLQIYDGTDVNAPLLAQFGDENPTGVIKASNSDGALTFHFVSDGSLQRSGWEAFISCFDPPQHDLYVSSIAPVFVESSTSVQPTITIGNGGLNDENSYQLWYTNKDGSYTGTQAYTDNVPNLDEISVQLPSWSPADGYDTLTVAVILSGDEDNSNDTLMQSVYIGDYNDVYGGNTTKSTYYTIDESTGDTTNVGTIGSDPFPMAEEFVENTTYRVNSDLTFGTVNPIGGFNELGTLSGISGTPTGLAYNWFTKTLYIAVLDGSNVPHICTVNLSTLELTEVSTAEGMIIGMDFGNDGLLYAATIDNDQVIKINPNTGETTVIGDIGIDLNYGQDVSFDIDSNRLYTVTSGDAYKYGYYDLTNGAFTEIKDMGSEQYGTFVITKKMQTSAVNFTVTDGTNNLANAEIQIDNLVLTTDASGTVSAYLPDGNYSAVTSLFGYNNDTTDFTVAGAAQDITITLTELPTYDITFHVVDALGNNLENADVLVMYDTDTVANGQTDANGEFAASSLSPYDYPYTVSLAGYITVTDTLNVTANATEEVTLLEDMVVPFGLIANQLNTDADVEFKWNQATGFTEDFEAGALSEDWTIQQTCTDVSGAVPSYWTVNDYSGSDFGPFGSYHAGLWWSYDHQDEWLITPEFIATNGMTASFYAVCAHGSPNGDHYYLKASTDGGSTWDIIWDASALPYVDNDGDGSADIFYYDEEYSVDLSAYAGQNIKLAWQAVDGDGQGLWFIFFVDNINIELAGKGEYISFKPEDLEHISYSAIKANNEVNSSFAKSGHYNHNAKSPKVFESYTVLLDGAEEATNITDSSYVFQDLAPGTYTAGVFSVYTTGHSDTATLEFTVLDQFDVTFNVLSATDSSAIENANIALANNDTTYNLTTDATGSASVTDIWEGDYTYTITASAFNDLTDVAAAIHSDTTITVYMTPAVNIAEINDAISIFPNPTSSLITINVDDNFVAQIIDAKGNVVISKDINAVNNTIDLSNVPAGVYILKLQNDTNIKQTKVIVK